MVRGMHGIPGIQIRRQCQERKGHVKDTCGRAERVCPGGQERRTRVGRDSRALPGTENPGGSTHRCYQLCMLLPMKDPLNCKVPLAIITWLTASPPDTSRECHPSFSHSVTSPPPSAGPIFNLSHLSPQFSPSLQLPRHSLWKFPVASYPPALLPGSQRRPSSNSTSSLKPSPIVCGPYTDAISLSPEV